MSIQIGLVAQWGIKGGPQGQEKSERSEGKLNEITEGLREM